MNLLPGLSILGAIVALPACQTNPASIAQTTTYASPASRVTALFQRQPMTPDSGADVIRQCLPNMQTVAATNIAKTWRYDSPGPASLVQNLPGSSYLLTLSGQSICLPRHANGWTIFPAEAFEGTVVPEGVAPSVRANWMMEIARIYASKGEVSVVYELPNGGSWMVRYNREPRGNAAPHTQPGTLPYTYDELRVGSSPMSDLKFGGQGVTRMMPKAYNGSFAKAPFDRP